MELNTKLFCRFDENGLGFGEDYTGATGLMSANGKWEIPPLYDRLGYPGDGIVVAERKGKTLCLDVKGNLLLSLEGYRLNDTDQFESGLLKVEKRQRIYFVNTQGKVAHGPYWYASNYSSGLCYTRLKEHSQPAFVDVFGNPAFTPDPQWFSSEYFFNGLLEVSSNGLFGLVDLAGNMILDLEYTEIEVCTCNRIFAMSKNGGVIFNAQGSAITTLPSNMRILAGSMDGLARYTLAGKYGYIDVSTGVILTNAIYSEAGPMFHGLAPVSVG